MVFLSLSARVRINAEALNMVESIGNYVRHRRAPVVIREGGKYVLRYVPAISGESLAHAYQVNLATLAEKVDLPVCKLCSKGVFIKHASDDALKIDGIEAGDPIKLEEEIIKRCVIEDVGGYMYAGTQPSKRTSRIAFGYALPVEDSIKATAVEAQFHVRYDPRAGAQEQAIYNVELASAVYGILANLDVEGIGRTSMLEVKDVVGGDERLKRVEIAVKALTYTIGNLMFGAKRSRFMPSWRVESAVALISHPVPLATSSPHVSNYLIESIERAFKAVKVLGEGKSSIKERAVVITYPEVSYEVGEEDDDKVSVECAESFSDFELKLVNKVMELVGR